MKSKHKKDHDDCNDVLESIKLETTWPEGKLYKGNDKIKQDLRPRKSQKLAILF